MDVRLIHELEHLLGPQGVLAQAEDVLLYEYDGSIEQARPDCIVFPRNRQHALRAGRCDLRIFRKLEQHGL